MKSFIIAGPSRSGKSTLARRVQKETGFSLVSADALIGTFEWVFPDVQISQKLAFDVTSEKLVNFLVPYINHMVGFQNIPFILDIYHMTPEQVIAHDLHTKYNVMFFRVPAHVARAKTA